MIPPGMISPTTEASCMPRAWYASNAVRRLSLRRTEPNFQLHVSLPDRRQPARNFFEAVHTLAERALS